jgi:TPR repeat protein
MAGFLTRLQSLWSPRAGLRLALEWGEGGRWDRAFPLLARAAAAGLAEAQYRVGRCYLEASGVPASASEAARWLRAAAEQGFVEAQALLATIYLRGLGADDGIAAATLTRPRGAAQVGAPDFAAARLWAERAAEAGSADGQALLAYILTSGPEAGRDLAAAKEWYRRAAEAGSPQGRLGLALALLRGIPDAAAFREAAAHLAAAAAAGLARAP